MADTFDNRRRNLRQLIEQWGGPKPLSDKLGYSNSSFMVQMAGPNPTREVTEKTARRIEQTLDLPPGWLDAQPREQTGLAPVDMTLIATVIRVVAQSAEDDGIRLSPSKLGDLVAVVYQDAESHNNTIRPEFINQVLRLVK
jgi:hypothetical protein